MSNSNSTGTSGPGLGMGEIAAIAGVVVGSFVLSVILVMRLSAIYDDDDFEADHAPRQRKGGWKEWASLRSNLSIRQRLSTLSTYYSGKVEAAEGMDGNLEEYTRGERHENNLKLPPKQHSKPIQNDSTRTLKEVTEKENAV